MVHFGFSVIILIMTALAFTWLNKIQNSNDIWQILTNALHTKRIVTEVKKLDALIADMFIESVEGIT